MPREAFDETKTARFRGVGSHREFHRKRGVESACDGRLFPVGRVRHPEIEPQRTLLYQCWDCGHLIAYQPDRVLCDLAIPPEGGAA